MTSDIAPLCKMLASCGFLLTAWCAGALDSLYGRLIFIGLAFSWFGDLFLIRNEKSIFLAGLVAFLLAHITYIAAFTARGIAWPYAAASLIFLIPIVAIVLNWLMPHVDAAMRIPVIAYTIIITLMVAAAAGILPRSSGPIILVGAILFYLSDITVARSRFIQPGSINALIGLPLYYTAQILLALSTHQTKP